MKLEQIVGTGIVLFLAGAGLLAVNAYLQNNSVRAVRAEALQVRAQLDSLRRRVESGRKSLGEAKSVYREHYGDDELECDPKFLELRAELDSDQEALWEAQERLISLLSRVRP